MILADLPRKIVGRELLLAQAELGGGSEVFGGEVPGDEPGPSGGGDHGSVVGGKSERREGDGEVASVGFGLEAAAKLAVGGDSPGDDNAVRAKGFGSGKCLALEVADDGVLEGGDQVEGLLVAEFYDGFGLWGERGVVGKGGATAFDTVAHMVGFDVAEDSGFDAAEGEVEVRAFGGCGGLFVGDAGARGAMFDLAEGERDGARVSMGRECVDPRAAGVAEAEELGDLVVGFAGGVVDGSAYVAVGPCFASLLVRCEIEVSVASGDDKRE